MPRIIVASARGPEGTSGFRVVDVWESEEAFGRLAETLGPILEEIGVEGWARGLPGAHLRVVVARL
jgi:hypothetical protein